MAATRACFVYRSLLIAPFTIGLYECSVYGRVCGSRGALVKSAGPQSAAASNPTREGYGTRVGAVKPRRAGLDRRRARVTTCAALRLGIVSPRKFRGESNPYADGNRPDADCSRGALGRAT